jgi:hypothetical protein
MQHQSENGAVPQMVPNSCEEFFYFALMQVSRQAVPLTNVMSPGYDGIGYFLVAGIGQVVVKHTQGN